MNDAFLKESLVPRDALKETLKIMQPEIDRLSKVRSSGYTDWASFLNVPFDEVYRSSIKALAQEKRALTPKAVVLIGTGGSSVGARAIHEALNGQLYNERSHDMKFFTVETLDSDAAAQLQYSLSSILEKGDQILIVVVSKSGTTIETMANAALFVELVKIYRPDDYHKYVVVVTDKDSPAWQLGQKAHYACLEIPKFVGGRYSVFTAAALFPLALLGIDIDELCKGAAAMVDACLVDKNNLAAISAALLFYHYSKGIVAHNCFFFDAAFQSVGMWCRQLLAESVSKKQDKNGTQTNVGIIPLVSVATLDLHSMIQLYLAGPHTIFTTFIPGYYSADPVIPNNGFSAAHGKKVGIVKDAIYKGVLQAYLKQERPYMIISGIKRAPYEIGQFMQMKMIEIVLLGFLMNVDPFDQPEIELYKKDAQAYMHG